MARQGPKRFIHPSPLALGVAAFFVLLAAAPAFAAPPDTTPPSITLYSPAEGAQLADDRPIVFGVTERGAAVTVNGLPSVVNLFDGTFEVRDLTLVGSLTVCEQSAQITVTSTDAAGNVATLVRSVRANFCVSHPRAVGALPAIAVALGQTTPVALDLSPYFADDGGGDLLIYSTYVGGDGPTASYSQGAFSFAWPETAGAGTFDLTVIARDRDGEVSAPAHTQLTVGASPSANHAPVLAAVGSFDDLPVGGQVEVPVAFTDADGDAVMLSAEAAGPGTTVVAVRQGNGAPATVLVSADAAALKSGYSWIRVVGVDPHHASASREIAIPVYDPTVDPSFAIVSPAVPEVAVSAVRAGMYAEISAARPVQHLLVQHAASDLGGIDLEVAALNDEHTYWRIPVSIPATPGVQTQTFWVSDPGLPTKAYTFAWTVLADPLAPSLTRIVPTTGSLSITEGDALGFQAAGSIPDPGHTAFTWAVDGKTVSHSEVLTSLHLTPGTHTVTLTASSPGGSSSTSASVTVSPQAGPRLAPQRSTIWPIWIAVAGLVAVGIILGGTEVGIYFLLAGLVGAIVDRQNREKLLTHFVRGRIYQIIEDEPGIHLSELQRKAGVARGVCAYHLHALEKAGLIKTAREGMYLRFFATKVKIDAEAYTLAADDRAVLEAIEARPGMTEQQVAELLGKPGGHVARSVRALSQSGYVEARREGEALQLFARTQRGSAAPPASGP